MTWIAKVRTFVAALPTLELFAAGLCLVALLGWGWLHEHDQHVLETAALTAKLKAAESRDVTWTKQLALVDTVVRHDSVRVTRTTARVDTLWRQVPETLVTRADTVKALNALPELRLRTDSAIAACSEYQSAFYRYRTACDSLQGAKNEEIAILKKQLGLAEPGKYHSVLTGGKFVGTACFLVSLWRHKRCWASR
jgi:hypothetical protein